MSRRSSLVSRKRTVLAILIIPLCLFVSLVVKAVFNTEKAKLEAELEANKSNLESAAKLLEQLRAMHDTCVKAEATIAGLSDKKKDQITVPELDLEALESLEQALGGK